MNTTVNGAMIELDGVEKVYRTDRIETVALSGVSLAIHEGQFVSVMGPSGCGKSTLLHVMGLLDVATQGSVTIGGRRVDALGDRPLSALRNRDIGFVFQTFHLVADLSVADNVEIPLLYRKGLGARERRERALAAIDRVGLCRAGQALPHAALRRPAAARRDRPGDRRAPRASCSPTSRPATSTARWATRSWASSTTSTRATTRLS